MSQSTSSYGQSRLVGAGALVWFGFLAGVSMLATPIKFTAPSLTLPVALDVGRVTFAGLNMVEIAAAAILVVLVLVLARTAWTVAGALLMAALVAAQTLWLLPQLDARVETIIGGGVPPESSVHLLYVVAEGAKLLILLALGILNLWPRSQEGAPAR